ncbi:hypothetical protein ABK040_012296 [Willaertia magna]
MSSDKINIDLLGTISQQEEENQNEKFSGQEEQQQVNFNDIKPSIAKEEQQEIYENLSNLLGVYGKCIVKAELVGMKEEEEKSQYSHLCSMNEFKKNETQQGFKCIEKHLNEKNQFNTQEERDELFFKLNPCLEEPEALKYVNKFQNTAMRGAEPESLKNLYPKVAQLLTSKQLQKNNGDIFNFEDPILNKIEYYNYNKTKDTDESVTEKLDKFTNFYAKKEFEKFNECVTFNLNDNKELQPKHISSVCFKPGIPYLFLLSAITCKKDIFNCLLKKNQLYDTKVEDSSLFDFVDCCEEPSCRNIWQSYLRRKYDFKIDFDNE